MFSFSPGSLIFVVQMVSFYSALNVALLCVVFVVVVVVDFLLLHLFLLSVISWLLVAVGTVGTSSVL